MTSQLKFGAILSYLSIGVNIIAGLVYTPWMIRQIGQSDFGLYTLATSLISLFVVDLGLGLATSRYVAKYRAENNEEKIQNFLGLIFKLYLFLDVLLFLSLSGVFFFIDSIYASLTPIELKRFKIVFLISAAFSILNFPCVSLNGVLNAYEKFIQLKFADVLYRILSVGITVIALLLNGGLYAVVAVHAFVGIVVIVYKIWAIRHFTTARFNFRYSDRGLYKDIFSFSLWTTISSLAQRLIFNISPSILGMVANSSHVAVFGVVMTFETFTYTIVNAINGMFMTRISRIHALKDHTELLNLLVKVGRFQYALNGLVLVGFVFIGAKFIKLWVGEFFSDAYVGLLFVIFPGIFYYSLQIANTYLIVTKNVHIQAYVTCFVGGINFILSFIFSEKWGVLGACFSIFIVYTIRVILLIFIYYKKLKINIPHFLLHCYGKMSLPILFTFISLWPIHSLFDKSNNWLSLGVEGVIVFFAYFVMLFIFGLKENERRIVIKKIKLVN